jgi:hypothetical protein
VTFIEGLVDSEVQEGKKEVLLHTVTYLVSADFF